MRIELDTLTASEGEYTALIALLASLGGRLPDAGIVAPRPRVLPAGGAQDETTADRPAPPPPPGNNAADALMQAEEARVAAERAPPPPSDGPLIVDADGIPWDARIHAGTKSQTKGGTWTKLRSVNEVLYGEVHAELQERYANDPNVSTSTGTTGAELAHGTGVEAGQDAPAPPPPSSSGNDAAASAPTDQETAENVATVGRFADFPGFVQAVNAIRTPPIPYLELNTFAQTVGVAGGFKDMKDHPELWESFFGLAGGQ